MAKLIPYNGNEPYIFISYAHRNSDKVMPIIERLMADGYRVWYDEGIVPGTEWDEYIADHIKACGCVVSMISKEYMESDNCKDELKYARDKDKPQLLIYLSEATLTEGLQMRLNRLQAVHKYAYSDEEVFYKKVYESDLLECCRYHNSVPVGAGGVVYIEVKKPIRGKGETSCKPKEKKVAARNMGIAAGVVGLLLIVAALVLPSLFKEHQHEIVSIPGFAPLCTRTGLTDGEMCNECGEVLVEQTDIPALGHIEIEMPAVTANCISAGLTAGTKCSRCGEILVAQTVVGVISEHEYGADDRCVHCGTAKPSEGLYFISIGNGTCYLAGIGNCTDLDIVVPSKSPAGDQVTMIYDKAFEDNTSLTSIVIPDGVISIGDRAFAGCVNLKEATMPNSIAMLGTEAFIACKKLESIVVPANVTYIPEQAFAYCEALKSISIQPGVQNIDWGAFTNCQASAVHITDINAWASISFKDYSSNPLTGGGAKLYLNGVLVSQVALSDGIERIGEYAFFDYVHLTGLDIPASVTHIGERAFANCRNLTEIRMPDSLISIGDMTFVNCGLEHVMFGENSKLESLGYAAFSGCDYLTSVILPDALKTIGNDAFVNCTRLAEVHLPSNLTYLGESVFRACSIEHLYIPVSLTTMAGNPFAQNSLKTITVADGNPVFLSVGNCLINRQSKTLIIGGANAVIPNDGSIEHIGGYAFHNQDLEQIHIPEGVVQIGSDAFSYNQRLTSVTMPNTVKTIDIGAFRGCDKLPSIHIPESVTYISYDAFQQCHALATITVAEGNPVYHASGNCLIRTEDKALLIGTNNSVIPEDGSVTSISSFAFWYCSSLKNIVIPKTICKIGACVFYYCGFVDIYFHGTVAEWEAIEKDENWASNMLDGYAAYTVHCTNGDLLG